MLSATPNPASETTATPAQRRFWRRHGRLVALLTLAWAAASLLPPLLAIGPSGHPAAMTIGLWLAVEAVPVVFVAIVWIYARRVDALDAEHGAHGR